MASSSSSSKAHDDRLARLQAQLKELGLAPSTELVGSRYSRDDIKQMLQKRFTATEDRIAQPGLDELQV
jgi:methylmalonyl-CoA mutase cobalamin-binding subunit